MLQVTLFVQYDISKIRKLVYGLIPANFIRRQVSEK